MSTSPALTTTSYAILGLLAVKPFTTYEIARQMDRALGQFWPRARSKIYEEPKKLVALKLAESSVERHGRRARTLYSITPAGREALREWLAQPGDGPVLEFEQLIKVFFCEFATRAELMATLQAAKRWSAEQTTATAHVAFEYVAGRGPFPERLPWLILVGRFLDDFLALVDQWATWALDQAESWPDDLVGATPDIAALQESAQRAIDLGASP